MRGDWAPTFELEYGKLAQGFGFLAVQCNAVQQHGEDVVGQAVFRTSMAMFFTSTSRGCQTMRPETVILSLRLTWKVSP